MSFSTNQAESSLNPVVSDIGINWRIYWYPVAFETDLPLEHPYGFSIFAEPFVLFKDGDGRWICLADRCPHRLAKLSDGQMIDGRLECLYHGWQFGHDGACLHIPHLLTDADIPKRANVQSFPVKVEQGIVWVWADADCVPQAECPHQVSEIDQPGVFKVDTATDLPFDHAFLVENLLDPAHVYISHDRTELGIRREAAAPLKMEIMSTSQAGIEGRFRRADAAPQAPWTSITFHAPILVHYSFSNPAYGVVGGLALYALPINYGHSRILVRRYGNFFKRPFTLKPRWLEHLRQNKILEEDLAFIVAQDQFFRETDHSLKSAYFPLKTCDTFVMEHRRWLDQFGHTLPWYVGFATAKSPQSESHKNEGPDQQVGMLSTRFERHTKHCQACRETHQRLHQIQRAGQVGGVVFLAMALLTEDWWQLVCVIGFVLMAGAIAIADNLRQRFEH